MSGSTLTPTGEPRTGDVAVHLALYGSLDDQEPLWTEDQLVTLRAGGLYQVWVGATSKRVHSLS